MRKRTKEFYEKMNRIMEELAKTSLSENGGKYAWALYRQSFGYGEYKVKIKGSKMADLTGISETHICDTKKRLKERNIIQVNGKVKGFNLNTDEWENFQLQGTFKNFQLQGRKTSSYREEKLPATGNLSLVTKKKKSLKKDFYKKLSRKEIEKLESDKWYKAIMWNVGEFSIFYIEGTISDYPYNTRMSCWYKYEEAINVRDKEAFFSHLLRNYQENLEN